MNAVKRYWEAHEIDMRNRRIIQALESGVALDEVADTFHLSAGYIACIANEAQYTPKNLPPADGSLSERDQFIVARALDGDSFTAIGRDHGITRERVRQIVKREMGVGARDGLMAARAEKKLGEARALAAHLVAERSDLTHSAIAAMVGLPAREVYDLMGQDEVIRRSKPRQAEPEVSDEEIWAEMRRVAFPLGGRALTADHYDENRSEGSVGQVRIVQRFGTWREACEQAGVPSNRPPRTDYTRRWSREDLLRWVLAYLDSTDQPSYAGMTVWLREQADAPSSQTIRNTVGRWIDVKREAVQSRSKLSPADGASPTAG